MGIRSARPEDEDALDDICLRTGADGADATDRFADPRLLGDVWVGPYLAFEPELAFVLELDGAPQGYVLGCLDTTAFEQRCAASWWPALQQRHPLGSAPPGTWDADLVQRIHAPPTTPADVVREHPSHLHVDLLPAAQGGGWGRRLIDVLVAALRERGSPGVHLGVAPANARAVGFYAHLGFRELASAPGVRWLGRPLG